MRTLLVGVVALVLGGCMAGARGGAAPLKSVAQFPDRDRVEALTTRPVGKLNVEPTASVRSWRFEENETAAWHALSEELSGSKFQARPELSCAAVELARVYAEHGKRAPAGLQRYLVARCGSTTAQVAVSVASNEFPEELATDKLIPALRESMRESLDETPAEAGKELGLGAAWHEGELAVAMVLGRPEAQVKPSSLNVEATNRAEIQGRLLEGAEMLRALVNQGEHGVAPCAADPGIELPQFRFICDVDPDAEVAWAELIARRKGRVLENVVGRLLLRREGTESTSYERAGATGSAPKTADALRKLLLGQINAARKASGMEPLTASPHQAAFNEHLAPHYFHDALEGRSEEAEAMALGALAGWEVREGGIINAGLSASLVRHGDSAELASDLLELPNGRVVVLEPDMDRIAIGAMIDTKTGVSGALITTYRFHQPESEIGLGEEFFERVAKTREARGLPATTKLTTGALKDEAKLVRKEGKHPMVALETALRRTSRHQRVATRGWLFQTMDVELMPIPEELLETKPLSLDVEVAYVQAKNATWGQYAVLIIAADKGYQTAQRHSTSRHW